MPSVEFVSSSARVTSFKSQHEVSFLGKGKGDCTEAEVAVQRVGVVDERVGHTDPASFSESLFLFVLNFVKISLWYRSMFVILLNHCNL